MPTYEYRCKQCATLFERIRPVAESGASSPCPECGADAPRAFSPVGVVFKGSGFHNTDYKPRPKDEGATLAPSEPSSGTKELKPANEPKKLDKAPEKKPLPEAT